MIISFEYKYIFIKNRKVAGSSIQYILKKYLFNYEKDISSILKLHDHEVKKSSKFNEKYLINNNLSSNFNQHASLVDICAVLKMPLEEVKKNFFIFCIERNSYDKSISSYEFSRKKKTIDGNLKCPYLKNFIDIFDYPKLIPSDWKNYTINNQIMIDKIFQFSELNLLIEFLNDKFNSKIPNKEIEYIKLKSGYRDSKIYRDYFNHETRNAVNYFFKNEINFFKYKF